MVQIPQLYTLSSGTPRNQVEGLTIGHSGTRVSANCDELYKCVWNSVDTDTNAVAVAKFERWT